MGKVVAAADDGVADAWDGAELVVGGFGQGVQAVRELPARTQGLALVLVLEL